MKSQFPPVMGFPEPTVPPVFSPGGFLSVLQDMCKISLMYCKLIKERAEALSLSEQNEGEAANKVSIWNLSWLLQKGRAWPWFLGKEGAELLRTQLTSPVWAPQGPVGHQKP